MAASEETCDGNPNFAIICSFITKFGDDCGVNISIPYLQQMLEDTKNVNEDLQELLIHLLRRGRKRVNKERWEKCLIKFCHEYSSVDAWEIERFGFTKAKLSVKLEILKRLLELQFDANAKFKAEVNKLDASSLRLLPIGRDIDGQAYWYQFDKEYNIRLYRETIGEEGAWQLLCSNTDDLRKLLANLEKKGSGSSSDACEDKSNDSNNPKSPDMLPVPKKELDTEDLTSHLSESKPCTIIIKTEKRDAVSHSEVPNCVKNEKCAIETDKKAIGCELENSTKGSVKLKLKLEPSVHSRTEHKSFDRTVVECSAVVEKAAVVVLDTEPMEVETSKVASSDAELQPKSVPVNDVEMVDEENASTDKVRSESVSEEQSDQNFSTNNNNPTVVIDHSDSVHHHKSSKIRLYEKWSSEKKKLDTSKPTVEECIDYKTSSVVEEKDQSYSVASNQKNDPAIPLKYSSEQSSNSELTNKQTDLAEQNENTEVETAVDLSKSSRVNVIVQNMCSKPVLPNGVSSTVKSNTEKSEKDSGGNFNSNNKEVNKKSDSSSVSFDKYHESSLEMKYKSLETESNKIHKRNQSYSDCYDTSVITKTSSVPGFSHLQALQNMCESNTMGGIPSVIQSTNRHSAENNRTVISENKTVVNCDIRYENMSRKYNFNDVHCSNDKTISTGSGTLNMVLKSNVHKSNEERDKQLELKSGDYQGKNKSSNLNTITNEEISPQELPTDLSCSDHSKPDNYDPKSSENLNKSSASTVHRNEALATKEKIGLDAKEKGKMSSPEKPSDLSKKSDIYPINNDDSFGEKGTNLCSSSEKNALLGTSVKVKESPDKESHVTELCLEKKDANSSKSAIKSDKTGSSGNDAPSELPHSEKLQRDVHKKFSQVRKDISITESVKELDKTADSDRAGDKKGKSEPVSKSIISSSSPDKCKEEILVSVREPTNSPNSVLKVSEDEPALELKEHIEAKSKSVNDTPSLVKKSACLKTPKSGEKLEKIISAVKLSSVAESKASVDIDIANKKQKVITDEILSKPSEISSSEGNKPPGKELNTTLLSEATGKDENVIRSNETIGCEKSKTGKSSKEGLDLTVHKKILNEVSNKSSYDNSSNFAYKMQASDFTNSGKISKNDVKKVPDKGNDVEKVSVKETDVKKALENEKDLVKACESEIHVKRASESEMGVDKISENKLNTEKVPEKRKVVKNISENKLDAEQGSENEVDMEKVSENKMDLESLAKKEINFGKLAENKKDVKKDSESEKGVKKVFEEEMDVEKVSDNEMSKKDVKKVAEYEMDVEKVSDNEMDVEKVSDNKMDGEKVSPKEMDAKKASQKEINVEKVSQKEIDVEKASECKMDMEKVSEKEINSKNVPEDERDTVKVLENERDVDKISKNENYAAKESENEKDADKKFRNEKKAEKEKGVEKISENENYAKKASETEKDVKKASKHEKGAEKVSENEKDAEKVSKKEENVEKISKKEKNAEKVSEKEIEVGKESEDERNAEQMSKKEKNIGKMTKKEIDLEKVTEKERDVEKVTKRVKDVEKVTKKEREVEKVDKKEKNVEKVTEKDKEVQKVDKKDKVAEKVDRKEKDVEKLDKKEKVAEKIDNKEKDVEKVDKKEKDVEKVTEKKKDEEKVTGKEKDVEKVTEKEKHVEKVTGKEKDVGKVDKKEKHVGKVTGKEKDVEKVTEKEKHVEKVTGKEKDVGKVDKKEKHVGKVDKKEKDVGKVDKKEKNVEKVDKKEKDVEKVDKKEKDEEKMHKKGMDVEKVTKKEKDMEKVAMKEKDGEKLSKNVMDAEKVSNQKNLEIISEKVKDLPVVSKNKKDNEKVSEKENDIEKVSENEKDEGNVSEKHKDMKREHENQNDVKKVSENRKPDTKVSQIEKDAEKISKKGNNIEKISEKECSSTVEENKKLSVDDCDTIEGTDKLSHKSCSSGKKDINKSEKSSKSSASFNDKNKGKCLGKESDDKDGKSCAPKDDSVVKLKPESSNKINKEKPEVIKTDFTDKNDKLCSSKVDSEEKLNPNDDEKSEAISEKNVSEPQNIDSLTENESKKFENKTEEKEESSANDKDVEMSDINFSSKATEELSDVMKPEDTCKKSDDEGDALKDKKEGKISKPRRTKGRSGRKTFTPRRKTRNRKKSPVAVTDQKTNCETVASTKGGKGETEELSIVPSVEESKVSSSKETDECSKSDLKSKVPYEEQLKVYNFRHSTCLETKFKHPFCDKYVIRTRELNSSHVLSECTIELTNDENLLANFNGVSSSNTKTRSRGKNSKQPVNKKPESISTPVTKPAPPAKKTPASSAKKRQSRNRKREDSEKEDFTIPEGFLEILGNAEKAASDKGAPRKKRKGSELKDTSASQQNSENESAPIKRSRRIQEQHQKKMTELAVEMEREQRILEQLAKRSNNAKRNAKPSSPKPTPKVTPKGSNAKNNAKGSGTPTKSPKARAKIQALAAEEETCMESKRATRKMHSRSKNLTKMTLMYEDESKDSQFSTSRETEKSKRRRRGRGQKKGFRPWDVSSESESSIEELTEEEEEEPDEPLIFDVNEDEFACEEVDPDAEPVIVRRARTAKKTEIEAAEECINDDTPCKKCGKYDKPEWILLCDKCDSGYHTHCLIPPLMIVPDGDWFCQPCEHMFLCQCLQEELNKLEVVLKQKEREELRKQRLAYVGISLDNVLKPEKKEKSDESEKEEKEEEKEEEEEEDRKPPRVKQPVEDERHQKLYGKRSVRARRNVNYQFKEYDALIASALQEELLEVPEDEFKEEDGSEAGSDKPFTAKISKRKKRSRRWKDLEFSDEEDSEDDYQGGSTDSEATQPPSSNSDQESGSGEWKISKSKKKAPRKPPKSRRRKRGGDSSEEDWEDEVGDNEAYRPTTRRAAQKAISYRELSSDDEDEWSAKPQASRDKKRRKASSSESEASFKRKSSKKKRICKWASSDSSGSEEEKSMSSSEGESEEEGSQEDESENDWKIDQKEKIMRLKSNTNKKVLSSEEDEESSTQDSAPKKQPKKIASDESEEEDDEEDEDDSESEENSEESEEEDEEEVKEKKIQKKPIVPEKKVLPASTNKITHVTNSKPDSEKQGIPSEKTESTSEKKSSIDKPESLPITENREFQPKVLVKKELCSVDIPLEPIKQTATITPIVDKAPPKTVRKETTKMVPCVIPYDKSPKSGHASNPEDESDKETSKEEEMPLRVPPQRPAHFPKQGTTFTSPPSGIQFGGVLARHSVPPLSSSVRAPVPPRMLAPTNLSTRPSTTPSVVVRHTASPSNLSVRPSIPPSNMPMPSSIPSTTAPPTQTAQTKSENKPYKSTIMEPFSNMDDENDSDEEVPLERIPNARVPAPLPNRPISYEREAEYRPAAKELSTYSYAPPEEKPFPGSYSSLSTFQDFSTRPSPLKPSLVETYPNNSSPSKLTPLDTYSQTSSPKGFISLDSYSETTRKKKHFYGNTSAEADPPTRPPPSSSENYQGGEIRFPPEPYPCPQSPTTTTTYPNRSPSPTQRDPGTPPRLYSQFPDAYAPPRSPEYYQNHQYYASEERIPRPSYQPNYAPQEPSFVSNPYVATPVPQPNGGFMIDTLLRARNHENEEDELTGVTDIVSYITQE